MQTHQILRGQFEVFMISLVAHLSSIDLDLERTIKPTENKDSHHHQHHHQATASVSTDSYSRPATVAVQVDPSHIWHLSSTVDNQFDLAFDIAEHLF